MNFTPVCAITSSLAYYPTVLAISRTPRNKRKEKRIRLSHFQERFCSQTVPAYSITIYLSTHDIRQRHVTSRK